MGNQAEHSERRKSGERVRAIFGIDVQASSKADTIGHVNRQLRLKTHTKYAFLNAHSANLSFSDPAYRSTLREFTVLADGVGVDIGAALLYGEKFPDNLNGTDFIPAVLKSADLPLQVALLGAEPGVAELAAEKMRKTYPRHRFQVVGHGFFDLVEQETFIRNLKSDRPDILLVAMGNPQQEKWIARHCTEDMATLAFAVGALFDFFADQVPRAPEWVRHMRMEWLHRLLLEPGRLWRRYIIGNPLFIWRVLMQKFSGQQSDSNHVSDGPDQSGAQ